MRNTEIREQLQVASLNDQIREYKNKVGNIYKERGLMPNVMCRYRPVSYTHLDVYKRQEVQRR